MTEQERVERAALWLAEQDVAERGDRAVGLMLGCNHRTVGRGRAQKGRTALTPGLVRYIDTYIEATGWMLDDGDDGDDGDVDEDEVIDMDEVDDEDADGGGDGDGDGDGDAEGSADNAVAVVGDGVTGDGEMDCEAVGEAAGGTDADVEAEAEADVGAEAGADEDGEQDGGQDGSGADGEDVAVGKDADENLQDSRDRGLDADAAGGDAVAGAQGEVVVEQTVEQQDGGSPEGDGSDESDESDGSQEADLEDAEQSDEDTEPVVGLPVVPRRAVTKDSVVADWLKDRIPQETTRRRQERRKDRLVQAFRQNLVRPIVEARSLTDIAALSARARREPLAEMYLRDGASQTDEATGVIHPLLAAFRCKALAELLETPVLAVLPVDVAIGAALTMVRREVTILDLPSGVHGDAAVLLLTGEAADYLDEGAMAVGFAAGDEVFEDGLSADEARVGVSISQRMKRYAHETHDGRPKRIGEYLSAVIGDKPYRDEDWRFGSPGWTDAAGYWNPGRAELVARWRLSRALYEDWNALARGNRWQYALYEARAELELMLLHPRYGMTFDRLITGVGRWPRSTRLGYETNGRFLQIEANQGHAGRMRKRRLRKLGLRSLVSWTVCWFPALVFALRRDFALYVENADRPRGKRRLRELALLVRRCRLYDRKDPSVRLPRLRDTVLRTLYEAVEEQGWFTRIISWLLYRRHSGLDGGVCGGSEWVALDPPLAPDYMTPNPRTGYMPSEAFHRRYRPHEYEPGYEPKEQPEEIGLLRRLGGALRGVGRGVRGAGRRGGGCRVCVDAALPRWQAGLSLGVSAWGQRAGRVAGGDAGGDGRMNFQQYLDRHGIAVRLEPQAAKRTAVMTCADVFEAWDCYTTLKALDPIRDVNGAGTNYELAQVYLRRMDRAARFYLRGVDRRGHQSLVACSLVRLVMRSRPFPTAHVWRGIDTRLLDAGGRLDFVRDYEAVSRLIAALLLMLEDIVNDTYLRQDDDEETHGGESHRR